MAASRYSTELRPDGQLAVYELRPRLVATFADAEMGRRFVAFMTATGAPVEPVQIRPGEAPEHAAPLGWAEVLGPDPGEAPMQAHCDEAPESPRAEMIAIPFVTDEELLRRAEPPAPSEPPIPAAAPAPALREVLSEDQIDGAFRRIEAGEKLTHVATELGVPYTQLRAAWANHKQRVAQSEREAGQDACASCGKAFSPTVSCPDRCHRCRP